MIPQPNTYNACLLQEQDDTYKHVEATPVPGEGIALHAGLFEEALRDGLEGEPTDYEYWGRLSLQAWHTLALMYALHHPESFRPIVNRWQALQQTQRRSGA